MSVATYLLLECHAQWPQVVDFRLKGLKASDSLEVIFLHSYDVSLTHIKLVLHVWLVNLELLLQAICVNDFVSDTKPLVLEHLNLFSQTYALLFLTFELLFKGLVDDGHEIIGAKGLPLHISSELEKSN